MIGLKIDRVAVERKVNTGNYDNTTWRVEAVVGEGESAERVAGLLMLHLVAMVRAEWERRYPKADERRWHMWLQESELPVTDWKQAEETP